LKASFTGAGTKEKKDAGIVPGGRKLKTELHYFTVSILALVTTVTPVSTFFWTDLSRETSTPAWVPRPPFWKEP